ncbi:MULTISPECIES: cysteine desulfurase family protein [Pseudomonadota]|uniref:cysteine desulfurase n=2 Tax=Burkholderiales TaxID=80840 RepID=W8X3G3_CASD6|nr:MULTISPECIES: cysteine desulfurase family protein [Pseudomonadota]OZA58882.1 MAG: cysteine desulfurase NifS [Acidovorax sp. 17-64-282]HQS20254.1 cysteine desulfurase family protein [Acidovorax defluvii]KAK52729.1 aminotransferase, class V [Bordetella bronchiseptica OSU054]KRG85977.1 cysteine desulfurase [Stenotrophomonas acidaminiphila]OYY28629.1 MAG: cysteine desulfurase NifS [Acidovorax sp. 35-64-16]
MAGIYLDYNASTPIAPEVQAAMLPLLETAYGNPSSGHWASTPAKAALEHARAQVAGLLGASPDEIVFTSGGSEANNLALKGSFFALRERGEHIITEATEHPAVLQPLAFLERLGASVTRLPVDGTGRVDPEAVRRAITPRTVLVSVMHANNETGTLQPIKVIGTIAREHGIRFHTDAAQSVGKLPTKVDDLGVDLLSIAGHKLYAPKGIGALYVRRGTALEPLIHGAGHEAGRRAGTESVLMAAALGAACELARTNLDVGEPERLRALRDHFWQALQAIFGERVVLNGHAEHRLPNTLNVNFAGRIGAEVLAHLDGVAASTGSACHAGRVELSPVLAAMGVPEPVGMGAVRFSLGRGTTQAEIDAVAERLRAIASR